MSLNKKKQKRSKNQEEPTGISHTCFLIFVFLFCFFSSRDGMIRHVMPAVDLSFHNGQHRNRGMCSVPRAHSWIDFSLSLDEWENYKIIVSSKERQEETWKQITKSTEGAISGAIERAMICLSSNAPDELGSGSHIVNVVMESSSVECPKNELRVLMDDDDFVDNEEAASGVLQVVISPTMAGSESEYLPEAYKPLYNDESLRNPLFAKFKQRKEKRND